MPTDRCIENGRQTQTDPSSSFPLWFVQNVRRYQVWPGVVVDRPLEPGGMHWLLCFGDQLGVPNAIMQADHLWTGKGDPSEWGRWIDELRHRGLIVVTEGSLESFPLLQRLGVGDWPAQYRTADGRHVTIERKVRIARQASYREIPYLVFTAEGRFGTVPWMIDVPTPHFLLTPKGFDWLDRPMAGVDDRWAPQKDKPTGVSPGGAKKKAKRPAWERLTLHRSSDGSDHSADLDGKRLRIRGNAAFKMLDMLQKKKGERIKAAVLQNEINQRPDRVLRLLDKRLQRIIDPPKKGVGYAML